MELAFDERKLLLPGVHDVTMDVVKQYLGAFQKSDRRMVLFEKLLTFVDAVKKAGCGQSIIVDGSFVMPSVDEPEDIDLVLVLPDGWDRTADLQPYQYNLISTKVARKNFGFDLFSAEYGSKEENQWIDYFAQVNPKWSKKFGWPKDLRKGVLRIIL